MSLDVYINSEASFDLWTYVRAVDTEIGGWGYAFFKDDGALVWDKTFLVPQIVSKSEVDFESTDGDAHAIERAAADGVLGKEGFVWVSWHSHHTMGPFWSSTDDKRIAALASTGISHLLSLVGCHDGKYRLRYDAFGVHHGGVTIPHVTMDNLALMHDTVDPRYAAIYDSLKANLKERPKVKAVTRYTRPAWAPAPELPFPKSQADEPSISVEEALEAKELMDEYDMSEREAVEMATYGKITLIDGKPAWTDHDYADEFAEAIAGGAQ